MNHWPLSGATGIVGMGVSDATIKVENTHIHIPMHILSIHCNCILLDKNDYLVVFSLHSLFVNQPSNWFWSDYSFNHVLSKWINQSVKPPINLPPDHFERVNSKSSLICIWTTTLSPTFELHICTYTLYENKSRIMVIVLQIVIRMMLTGMAVLGVVVGRIFSCIEMSGL